MPCRLLLLALLPLLPGLAGAQARQELRSGMSSSWSLPWGQLEAGRAVAGINHDIVQAVARRLDLRLRWVLLTQSKGEPQDGEQGVDLRCGIDPSWVRRAEAFHWSEPLFDISDQLVGHQQSAQPRSLSELPSGALVGTVVAYRYPTLEARFADGTLRRDDAPDQLRALAKLSRQRTAYAAVSPQVIAWYLRQQPEHGLASWRLKLQHSAYYCAVPRSSPLDPARLLETVHGLQREGELQRILDSYAPR